MLFTTNPPQYCLPSYHGNTCLPLSSPLIKSCHHWQIIIIDKIIIIAAIKIIVDEITIMIFTCTSSGVLFLNFKCICCDLFTRYLLDTYVISICWKFWYVKVLKCESFNMWKLRYVESCDMLKVSIYWKFWYVESFDMLKVSIHESLICKKFYGRKKRWGVAKIGPILWFRSHFEPNLYQLRDKVSPGGLLLLIW